MCFNFYLNNGIIYSMKGLKRFELMGSVAKLKMRELTNVSILELTLAGESERIWYHTIRYINKYAELINSSVKVGDPFLAIGEITSYAREDGVTLIQLTGDNGFKVDKAISYNYDKNNTPRMRGGKNEATVIGRIVRSPERRETNSGISFTVFTIAAADNTGKTTFIESRAFSPNVVRKTQSFAPGDPIWSKGAIYSTTWINSKGEKRFGLEFHLDEVETLIPLGQDSSTIFEPSLSF